MSRPVLALALAILLALPFLPVGVAASPAAEAWSPYDTISATTALAFARQGTTIAVALGAAPIQNNGCTTPSLTCVPSKSQATTSIPDLAILQSDVGWARNGTGNLAVNGQTTPLGRTHVVVTPDGRALASLGVDRTSNASVGLPGVPSPGSAPGSPSAQTTTLKLYVDWVPAGQNFTSSGESNLTVEIPGARAAGLAMSDDGARVAALVDDGAGNLTLLAYNVAPAQLQLAFSYTWSGHAEALVADGAMSRILVGGDLFDARTNATQASLVVVPYATGRPSTYYSEAANGTAVTSLAATPDASLVALGTNAGRVVLVDGAATFLNAYQASASGNVSRLALSADGTHLAAVAGGSILTFRMTGATPVPAWTATPAAHANGLSYNATGALLVASLDNGTDAGVVGYADDRADPLWSIPGEAFDAKVNDAGTEVAYRQGHVVDAQRLGRGFGLTHAAGGKVAPVHPLRAGASSLFDLVVSANGSAPETVALAASTDASLTATIDPPVVTVRPGEPRHVNVTLSSTPQFSGSHDINVTATDLATGQTDYAILSVLFEGVANVTFQVNQTEYLATPGLPAEAILTVLNNGTSSASAGLRYSQQASAGAPWDLQVDRTTLLVPSGSITTVRVTVTPPANTPNGTNDAVVFTLEGPNVSDTVTLHFRVNPHVRLDITAVGRVKFVEPSHAAFFNVTVTNTGSLPRAFTAFYDTTSANGKTWAVEMSTDPFRLEPGASRTLPVKVFAPADATPDDHVAVLVRARSVPEEANETFVEANVTLFANAVQPQITTSTPASGNTIPFPSFLGVAAAFGLAVLVRRRRSP